MVTLGAAHNALRRLPRSVGTTTPSPGTTGRSPRERTSWRSTRQKANVGCCYHEPKCNHSGKQSRSWLRPRRPARLYGLWGTTHGSICIQEGRHAVRPNASHMEVEEGQGVPVRAPSA